MNGKRSRRLVTGDALEQMIAEVQEAHIKRLDLPLEDLKPRPRQPKKRPKTALISEACMSKYYERLARESLRKKSA